MQNIVTLGEINDALKFAAITAAQLADMGFAPLDNKPICEALPTEQSRRLRNAKLYPADSIVQIRVALAKRLAAPASCLHQFQEPAPATALDALREAEAALEVAIARILKADPGHSISVTSEAKALVAVRAALSATSGAASPMPRLHIKELHGTTLPGGRVIGASTREYTVPAPAAVAVPDLQDMLRELRVQIHKITVQLSPSVDCSGVWMAHDKMSAALAATPAAAPVVPKWIDDPHDIEQGQMLNPEWVKAQETAAAAPVVLPEPDAAVIEVMDLVRGYRAICIEYADGKREHVDTANAYLAIEAKLRALLATATGLPAQVPMQCVECNSCGAAYDVDSYQAGFTDGKGHCPECPGVDHAAPQAQAVERGEVLVTVSGFTGSGKSAIAGEIEILCRALGLQVDWPGGDSEKNMTHADWTAALEQYKPRVRIVEHNVPTSESKNDH